MKTKNILKIKIPFIILLAILSLGIYSAAANNPKEGDLEQTSWHAFPHKTKGIEKSKLLVERRTPTTITPGENYTFYLKVQNTSLYKIDSVTLLEQIPENFIYINASPKPEIMGKSLKWNIGMMAPEQKEIISITGRAIKSGKVAHTGKASLSYYLGNMNTIMEVIKAELSLNVKNPKDVVINEEIPVTLTLKNLGTATVEDVKIAQKLKSGLATDEGDSSLSLNIGTVGPNKVKTLNFLLKASKTGEYQETIIAKGSNNNIAKANLKFIVGKPKFKISAKAPKMRFVGNNIIYTINIENIGTAVARKTETKLNLPSSAKFVKANEGGNVLNNQLVWDLGSLQPKEMKSLKAVITGTEITNLYTSANTTAVAANTVTTHFSTKVAGIPALLITLSDINDPVPVGSTETYNVKISNQGSLAAKNVVVKCKLENNMQYVKVNGPTGKQSLRDGLLVLKPLKTLAPKDSATWNVTVKAIKEGDARFKVYTESDQLTRPVYENESTHFYKD
ncbi:MAG: DUF11 domain-containing protein [bacterium]|nr:DUF11 domain-containing protein [bacterium]